MGVGETQETHLTNRQAGGFKATLQSTCLGDSLKSRDSNFAFIDDNVSDKAKQHAREILEAAGYSVRPPESTEDEHHVRVMAGYKAALNSKESLIVDTLGHHSFPYRSSSF